MRYACSSSGNTAPTDDSLSFLRPSLAFDLFLYTAYSAIDWPGGPAVGWCPANACSTAWREQQHRPAASADYKQRTPSEARLIEQQLLNSTASPWLKGIVTCCREVYRRRVEAIEQQHQQQRPRWAMHHAQPSDGSVSAGVLVQQQGAVGVASTGQVRPAAHQLQHQPTRAYAAQPHPEPACPSCDATPPARPQPALEAPPSTEVRRAVSAMLASSVEGMMLSPAPAAARAPLQPAGTCHLLSPANEEDVSVATEPRPDSSLLSISPFGFMEAGSNGAARAGTQVHSPQAKGSQPPPPCMTESYALELQASRRGAA